jgi:hypothetical protein
VGVRVGSGGEFQFGIGSVMGNVTEVVFAGDFAGFGLGRVLYWELLDSES